MAMSFTAIIFTFGLPCTIQVKCLLPDRPDFGLNIKFDPITCYILFHRFLDMLISILAAIFAFGPP